MPTQDLTYATIAEVAELVRSRKVSSQELVRACLNRIKALDKQLNACVTVMDKEARTQAKALDAALKRGGPLSPLHGVPFALKDNYETKGVRTTSGSHLYERTVPRRDSMVAARLKKAGAALIAKTQLSEFASGPNAFGPMINPWDTKRFAGGSSGGSGAGTAAGLFYGAMGHDTGGSIRIPSAFCGLVGLKPTYGRVSRFGIRPAAWSLDHGGPMVRSVRDAAIVLQAIAGYDSRDPSTQNVAVPDYQRGLGQPIKGMRLGIPKEWFFDLVDAQVKTAVLKAIRHLEDLGARTVEVSTPHAQYVVEMSNLIMHAELSSYFEEDVARRAKRFGPLMLQRLQLGKTVLAIDYLRAQKLRDVLKAEFARALRQADVVVTPTTAISAPLLSDTTHQINGKTVERTYAVAAFTMPFNHTGLPALTLPCGFNRDGMPLGMQIVGRHFDEATVLRVAHAYEQSTEWHKKHPRL